MRARLEGFEPPTRGLGNRIGAFVEFAEVRNPLIYALLSSLVFTGVNRVNRETTVQLL
jgi:hypothetical protein